MLSRLDSWHDSWPQELLTDISLIRVLSVLDKARYREKFFLDGPALLLSDKWTYFAHVILQGCAIVLQYAPVLVDMGRVERDTFSFSQVN